MRACWWTGFVFATRKAKRRSTPDRRCRQVQIFYEQIQIVIGISELLSGPEIIPAQVNVFQSTFGRVEKQQVGWRTLVALRGSN